jgi:tetratricopeptide (TPR) repeat protein/DNA-binding CsgD family transcriptional regulator
MKKVKTSVLFFLLLFPFFLPAQNRQDSLLRAVDRTSVDTQKVQLYFQLYAETAFNDPESADDYIQQALELSKSIQYQRGIILCYDKLGGLAMQNSDFDQALVFYGLADSLLQYMDWPREKAVIYGNYAAIYKDQSQYDSSLVWLEKFIHIAERISNESFLAFGKNLKGDLYHLKGQHELAARNYLSALRIYEKLGETDRQADALRLLGATQTSAGRYADAEHNLQQAVELYLQVKDDYYLTQAYRDLGYLLVLKKEYEKAEEYYNKALGISQRLEDPFGIAQAEGNLGRLDYLSGRHELALQQYQQALPLFQQMGDQYSTAQTFIEIADAWIGLKKYSEALDNIRSGEAISKTLDSPTAMSEVYKTYAEYYKATDQPLLALEAFEAYTVIKDSLNSAAKIRQLEELQLIYNIEKKDQEIALLAKDVQVGKLRRSLLTLGLLATFMLGALLIYMQFMRRKRERRLEEERHLRQKAELEKNRLEKERLERELASQVLQLCRKNELLASLKEEISGLKKEAHATDKSGLQRIERTIQSDIQSDDDWRQFLATFEKVHPDFLNQLRRIAQKISPAEQRLSCLLKMNLSSKEIATLLNITLEGVKKARYRLRKKLGLSSDVGLQEFLINLAVSSASGG